MTPRFRVPLLAVVLAASFVAHASPAVRPIHVALLGDSLAYGAGDEEGMGLAGRLQPELNRRGVASAVTTNLGTNGATTRDVEAKLRDQVTRARLAEADAIVLSMGANDLRDIVSGDGIGNPFELIDQVLQNVQTTVTELRKLNPGARILILGAYAPLPSDRVALLLEPLIAAWDTTLAAQFVDDSRVSIVRMSDILNRPERLSTIDSFHPGGEAYQRVAARIATMLTSS